MTLLHRYRLLMWFTWSLAALVLISCPMLLSEPAMWAYLVDPELLALVVVVGLQYTRAEAGVLSAAVRLATGRLCSRLSAGAATRSRPRRSA